jgi:hypothetical protein
MKDIYKNPIFYYILIPAVIGLWPLLVWSVYLPAADKNLEEQQNQYRKAEEIMMEILTLDPDRLQFADSNDTVSEFTYYNAIGRVAASCKIPPSKYKLSSGILQTTSGQKSQSASVSLRQVDIVKFASFLSMIQFRWPNLQCNRVKLTKKEGLPDLWDVDIEFKYYY